MPMTKVGNGYRSLNCGTHMQKVTEAKNFRQRSAVQLRIARISTMVVINIIRNIGEKI